MTFRTATGQTGRDAYLFEASAIANAQRELDARMRRLLVAMHDESPETFYHSTDYHPQLAINPASHAKELMEYVLKGRCDCHECERNRARS